MIGSTAGYQQEHETILQRHPRDSQLVLHEGPSYQYSQTGTNFKYLYDPHISLFIPISKIKFGM